ncbi:MAG: hypothetical protein J1E39_00810 [Eubacterium sp.]|nr:hypothetical protein [Eubacterium sp.]
MTKNNQNDNQNLTVAVTDESGAVIGHTYPKRAKGLVKKGRAEYSSDNVIRLKDSCPTQKSEENKMDVLNNNIAENTQQERENAAAPQTAKQYIFFDPRKWFVHPDVKELSVMDRFIYQSPIDDKLNEVITLGAWAGNKWSEITNGYIKLDKNTDYKFVFWLNGGENDLSNETCRFEVIYTDMHTDGFAVSQSDHDYRYIYKLNRSYIKPLKEHKGWRLYSIPIIKSDKQYAQFRFVAQLAPMTIMAAAEPESYAELPEIPDEFADKRPQRHNIVFTDGWPENKPYATKTLKSFAEGTHASQQNSGNGFFNSFTDNDDFMAQLAQRLADSIDTDVIAEMVAENLDINEISDTVSGNIDTYVIARAAMGENPDAEKIKRVVDFAESDEMKRIVDMAENLDTEKLERLADLAELEHLSDLTELERLADIAESDEIKRIIDMAENLDIDKIKRMAEETDKRSED